jgi:hypothetical protein
MPALEQVPLAAFLRTVIQALSAGLESGDRTCITEGIALLQWLEVQVRLNEDDDERRHHDEHSPEHP